MAKKQSVNEHGFLVDESGQVLTDANGQPQRADGQSQAQASDPNSQQQQVEGGDLANVGAEPTQVEGAPAGQGQPVQGGDTSAEEETVSREDQDAYLRDLGVLGSDDQQPDSNQQ